MLKSLALRERTQPLTVYGPPGLGELITSMRAAFGRLPYKLTLAELRPAQAVAGDGYTVAAIPVMHKGVSSYGYALVEDAAPGAPRSCGGRAARGEPGSRLRAPAARRGRRRRAGPSRSWGRSARAARS